MKKYAVIENGKVVNVIVWDGITPYQCHHELVETTVGSIGDDYVDSEFVKPVLEEPIQ